MFIIDTGGYLVVRTQFHMQVGAQLDTQLNMQFQLLVDLEVECRLIYCWKIITDVRDYSEDDMWADTQFDPWVGMQIDLRVDVQFEMQFEMQLDTQCWCLICSLRGAV